MPKKLLLLVFCFIVSSFLFSGCASKYKPVPNLIALKIAFADPMWDGKNVPKGQQCRRFGGKGSTPQLIVKNIPPGTNAIIMEYSDKSHAEMNKGGHGKIGYRIPKNTTEITVPSIPGHTFDLPEGFFLITAHRNPQWDVGGAYLPPCSGGGGNLYSATLKVVYDAPKGEESKLLGKGMIDLGRY